MRGRRVRRGDERQVTRLLRKRIAGAKLHIGAGCRQEDVSTSDRCDASEVDEKADTGLQPAEVRVVLVEIGRPRGRWVVVHGESGCVLVLLAVAFGVEARNLRRRAPYRDQRLRARRLRRLLGQCGMVNTSALGDATEVTADDP